MPASSSALSEASAARSEVQTPPSTTLLSLMPILDVIHSSLVSTILAMSSLVRTLGGM